MPSINYCFVRSRISMQQVLDLIQFQPYRRLGDELRGPCPVHGSHNERSRSFAVNVEKNVFHCFTCGAHGNQLDLWAAVWSSRFTRPLSIYASASARTFRIRALAIQNRPNPITGSPVARGRERLHPNHLHAREINTITGPGKHLFTCRF